MIIVSRSIKKRTKRGNTNNYLTWPFGNICRNLYFSNAKARVSHVSAGPPSISSISQYWILSNAIVMPESRWFVIALFPRVMDASTLLHNSPFISVLWAVTSMMMLNTPLTFRQQNNWQFVAAIFIFAGAAVDNFWQFSSIRACMSCIGAAPVTPGSIPHPMLGLTSGRGREQSRGGTSRAQCAAALWASVVKQTSRR